MLRQKGIHTIEELSNSAENQVITNIDGSFDSDLDEGQSEGKTLCGDDEEESNDEEYNSNRNERKRVCKEKLTDATAGGTKLEPALTLIPVLMRGKCA
ncbi:hypothetical protein TNCV_1309461 [Trichonephila clavipes]|nr:hypothetical protein TNCV_1309461 [Trichonephila clavipes]